MARKFFCIINSTEHGPLSAGELRRLAAEGLLKSDDLVWSEDAPRRIPAILVRGLFREKVEQSNPLDEAIQESKSNAVQADSRCPSHETARGYVDPIIRVSRIVDIFAKPLWCILHRYHVVAMNGDVIIDARYMWRPNLEEVDCTPEGIIKYLENTGSFVRYFPVVDTKEIRCKGRASRTLLRRLYCRPRVKITIRTSSGKRTLRMHRRDASGLLSRLEECSGIQIETKWMRYPGLVLLFVVWLITQIAIIVLTSMLGWKDDIRTLVPALLLDLIGPVLVTWLVRFLLKRDETPHAPIGALAILEWRSSPEDDFSGRSPFRCTPLGLAIKLVAAVWIGSLLYYHRHVIQGINIEASSIETSGLPVAWYASNSLVYLNSLLMLPAVALLYYGNSIIRRKSPSDSGDTRKPFLYLRSFALDGRSSLQPRGVSASMLGISGVGSFREWWDYIFNNEDDFLFVSSGLRLAQCVHPLRLIRLVLGLGADTTEQSLAAYFRNMGRVVAIGRPGERIAETGAHREYVKEDEWQDRVLSILTNCQGVLLQPSQSEGMNWELRTICERVPKEQILIVCPRINGTAGDYENLVSILEPLLDTRFPRTVPFRRRPVFIWFDKDGMVRSSEVSYRSPATWLFKGDAVDLEYTLRPFLQGMHGGDRELPRQVRRYGWLHWAAATACILGWMYATGFWLTYKSDQPPYRDASSITVTGVRPPYAIDIPTTWSELAVPRDGIEREFAKPGVGSIMIYTDMNHTDYSQYSRRDVLKDSEEFGDLMRMAIGDQLSELDYLSCQSVRLGDRYGLETRHQYKLISGESYVKYRVVISDTDGTVLLVIDERANVSSSQRKETRSIITSLRRH